MKIGTFPAAFRTAVKTKSARELLLYALALLLAVLGALTLLLIVVSGSSAFTWDTVAPAPLARFEAQGAAANGKLYVFGGYYDSDIRATTRSDVYDPDTDTWERIADMPEALSHSPVAVAGEEIYLLGGFVGDHPGPSTDHVWRYDTLTDTWSAGPPLPAPRAGGAAVLDGRDLHFYGGSVRAAGSERYTDSPNRWVLSLDDENASWEERAPLPNARNHLAGVGLAGKLYAIGGQHAEDEGGGNQREVDAYDPTTDTWTRVADLSAPRGHTGSSTFVMDGWIVAAGGSTNDGGYGEAAADVTAYNPATDSWSRMASLPSALKSPVADVIDGRIVVSTGNPGGSTPTAMTWVSEPDGS